MLVFRAVLHVDGGSPAAMRLVAAGAGALLAVLALLIALRMAGRIAACAAAGLAAVAGASPFIEGFTLAGETLAAVVACASLLAGLRYARGGGLGWLALAGALTGCAFMVKQSGVDAGLALFLWLLLTRRRAAAVPALVLVAAAAVPPLVGLLAADSRGDWWYAMVTYRSEGDSFFSEPLRHRLYLLGTSLPEATLGLAAAAVPAAYGWRRAPLLARLWLGAAAVGVLGGGNFHPHYYLQLVAPLAVLGAIGVARLAETRAPAVAAACAGALACGLLAPSPLMPVGGVEQADALFREEHLRYDAALAAYARDHTGAGERIFVVWAAAQVYYLADRPSITPYIWYRNVQEVPGALAAVRRTLAGPDPPALVFGIHQPEMIDKSGRTAAILRRRYRVVARIEGVPVYRPRAAARSTSAAASSMRGSRSAMSMYSSGVWSRPPTGPSPSTVGMPAAPVQQPSDTPPDGSWPIARPSRAASSTAAVTSHGAAGIGGQVPRSSIATDTPS
jgi:4-amino-4-deoxy-L-arabinose transferase-like glycosyltransferase